jgi:hypothetical protein
MISTFRKSTFRNSTFRKGGAKSKSQKISVRFVQLICFVLYNGMEMDAH